MQTQFPLFPFDVKLITPTTGFRKENGFVYYLHNGDPIFCHKEHDIKSFRFICGNLVETKLCTATELANALGVGARNIQRYGQRINRHGASSFFNKSTRKGECYKLTPELKDEAKKLLNDGHSRKSVARDIGVTEGAIRYHIRKGQLPKPDFKKKKVQQGAPHGNATK